MRLQRDIGRKLSACQSTILHYDIVVCLSKMYFLISCDVNFTLLFFSLSAKTPGESLAARRASKQDTDEKRRGSSSSTKPVKGLELSPDNFTLNL